MNALEQFKSLVAANTRWFYGVAPETPEALRAAELQLGCQLPPSLKWLLSEYGYSGCSGIPSLWDAVELTTRCRKSLGLPGRYVLLDDRGDGGVVCLDTESKDEDGECRLFWAAAHNVRRLSSVEPLDADIYEYKNYPEWCAATLDELKAEEGTEQ